jgi:hypothetical protein
MSLTGLLAPARLISSASRKKSGRKYSRLTLVRSKSPPDAMAIDHTLLRFSSAAASANSGLPKPWLFHTA